MRNVAILIDGAYFLKRLGTVAPKIDQYNPEAVAKEIRRLVNFHLNFQNKIANAKETRSLLYRIFYYDAAPYLGKLRYPVSGKTVNYAISDEARFRMGLFDRLRRESSTALRLGEVRKQHGWMLKEASQQRLLKKEISLEDLTDSDFFLGLTQKAVDMRIGVDIASLSLKGQVDTIVLVTGDADFVPASKLASREGVRVVLDPLWQEVTKDLFEHIDDLQSGFPRPKGVTNTRPRHAKGKRPATR